jgi:uncharacterized protein YkwD
MVTARDVEQAVLSTKTTEVIVSKATTNRRMAGVLGVCLAALLAIVCAPSDARASVTTSETASAITSPVSRLTLNKHESALLALINKARKNRGLAQLCLRASLYRAAKAHSRDMIQYDYFSHTSRDGSTVGKRVRRAGYSSSGYTSWKVGEVIAWGKDSQGSASAVFKMWMSHSAHRSVILAARWRDIGLGCVTGTYKGMSGVRMYTVDFGRRTR